jgi:hypothetical protein
MAKTPTGRSAPARDFTVGADYLNTRQLFSQDSQTQELDGDEEGLAEEQRIQSAFLKATEQHSKKGGRRVTFTEVVADDEELTTPDEEDEDLADDDLGTSLTTKDILTNLDGGADQFAKEVQSRPNYVYNLMGKLCNLLRLLQEHNKLLHQSNNRNLKRREQLASQQQETQERLQQAIERINELDQDQDPELESRATAQLVKMKEKTQWYTGALKEKEIELNKVNSDMAELTQERDNLDDECARLKEELGNTRGRSRSRARTPAERTPAASLSPFSKAHGMGPPPAPAPLPNRRNTRQAARSSSNATRIRRNVRGATAATDDTSASRATINLDPDSNKAIQVDRSVKDPDKFEGKAGTFYP